MNKSNNLEEFQAAMKMMQIPMFNTMFADKDGNIFYIYNALIPKEENGINWKDIVPGNFSDLIWTEYYAFSELPSSPYWIQNQATCKTAIVHLTAQQLEGQSIKNLAQKLRNRRISDK